MNKTKIPWADYTWNPISGCSPASEGCTNCYAQDIRKRFNGGDNSIQFHPARVDEPFKVRKPSRIFVCSMGDLFHPDVSVTHLEEILAVMTNAPQHTFMVLTKRPERFGLLTTDRLRISRTDTWPIKNLWLGVTCENQARADERIPLLLQTPAAVRFVSIEPMLGPVDLWRMPTLPGYGYGMASPLNVQADLRREITSLDWVICGPETGPRKRAFDEDWARSLLDQCAAANVAFFYKGGLLDGVKYEAFPEAHP